VNYARDDKKIILSILGISWFWFIGVIFFTQFPNFVKISIGGEYKIVTLMFTVFSIGIALGSLICNRILKSEITIIYAPLALAVISLFSIDLFFISNYIVIPGSELITLEQFLSSERNYRILFDLAVISIFGGIYIVPLYSMLQNVSSNENRARIIAASNIFDSGFMVIAAVFTIILFGLGATVPEVFLFVALINFVAIYHLCKLWPEALRAKIKERALKIYQQIKTKAEPKILLLLKITKEWLRYLQKLLMRLVEKLRNKS
jgi:acyl-[acyl-carrier-protein]-phospholipid O-acyltransferase/long-chain-fatty-acid--[acyl-carrier-protein] ligase